MGRWFYRSNISPLYFSLVALHFRNSLFLYLLLVFFACKARLVVIYKYRRWSNVVVVVGFRDFLEFMALVKSADSTADTRVSARWREHIVRSVKLTPTHSTRVPIYMHTRLGVPFFYSILSAHHLPINLEFFQKFRLFFEVFVDGMRVVYC